MMKHIIALELHDIAAQLDIKELQQRLQQYEAMLQRDFQLVDRPKAVVWTSAELATTVFSSVPVPAYTNRDLIYMTPRVDEWRAFYIAMLEAEHVLYDDALIEVKAHYEQLTIDDVFCVLAHELTHHIDLFPDEFDEERHDSIWFEEGMCEYLSQRLTLTDAQYNEHRRIEALLIDYFMPIYGKPLDHFGMHTYEQTSLAAIMLNYWRSAVAIHHIVEQHDGDIFTVFARYNEWCQSGDVPLTTFFDVAHI